MKNKNIDFTKLDKFFQNKSLERKTNYNKAKSSFKKNYFEVYELIDFKAIVKKEAEKKLRELFILIDIMKADYIKIVSEYLNTNINKKSYLKDYYWLESPRKIRHLVAHEENDAILTINDTEFFFNYFHSSRGLKSQIPLLHFYNDEYNLVNFKNYVLFLLECFEYLIFNIDKSKDKSLNNLSLVELETRKFISLFEYKKEKCDKLIQDYELGEYKNVNSFYIAELYLNRGVIYIENKDFQSGVESFKKSLELNHNIAQVSNIIGAFGSDISLTNDFVYKLIKENLVYACNDSYIMFFTNAGSVLSELNDNDFAQDIYEIGLNYVEENKESVDFLYNYAHFLKNDLKDFNKSILICEECLKIDPTDNSAIKMLLALYCIKNDKQSLLYNIKKYDSHISSEIKQHYGKQLNKSSEIRVTY